MGYEVYITRAKLWMKNSEDFIPLGEWQGMVNEDDELNWDPANGPHSARWNQCGSTQVGCFAWKDGNIFSISPTRAAVAKMLVMARALLGNVQGGDGECYMDEREWCAPSH